MREYLTVDGHTACSTLYCDDCGKRLTHVRMDKDLCGVDTQVNHDYVSDHNRGDGLTDLDLCLDCWECSK